MYFSLVKNKMFFTDGERSNCTISKLKKNVTDLFTQVYVEYLLSFKNNLEKIFPSKEILFEFCAFAVFKNWCCTEFLFRIDESYL